MTHSNSSRLSVLAAGLAGVGPALLAAYFVPGLWTALAAAGSAIATTTLVASGMRTARELGDAEHRAQQAQASAASLETRMASLESRMREVASFDEVSGVLNRRTFLTRLDEAIQRDGRLRKPMAFLMIDVQGFKKINGDAGRIVGDKVLRVVGRAIQASTRGTDFVGRIGGDEFAVMLGECADPRPAVDRVLVALHGETTGGDKPLPIRVCVGTVTIPEPQRGIDMTELFRIAEEALRSAAAGGSTRREYGAIEGRRPVAAS